MDDFKTKYEVTVCEAGGIIDRRAFMTLGAAMMHYTGMVAAYCDGQSGYALHPINSGCRITKDGLPEVRIIIEAGKWDKQ